MRDYPNRTAHSPLWTSPAAADAEATSITPVQIEIIETLCEFLATPSGPALVQMINVELTQRRCLYRLRRPGGAQRR